ncbi:MAG: GNAT family N-acetyltransferase [Chitinophagaceae bacterium]
MFLKNLTPVLETHSMPQTIDFYTNVLGFKQGDSFGHEGETSCMLHKDNVRLVFITLNADKQQQPATGGLYFYPTDIEATWQKLKEKAEVIYPLKEVPHGMREFAIKDNNGYTLKFGKDLNSGPFETYFPANLTLETERVQLRVLREEDEAELQKLTSSDTTWKYFVKDLSSRDAFKGWMNDAMQDYGYERRVPFLVIDKERNAVAGSTSYGSISFHDKRIEIGWSWLGDAFKGTGVNTHAKFLLLRYALETLQWERVEIKTDNLNERSKAALRKIGATPEGVLRNHMQMHSERRRDSIYFAVLKNEWEDVKRTFFKEIR